MDEMSQTIVALMIVAAASALLIGRLLGRKKSGCSRCHGCSSTTPDPKPILITEPAEERRKVDM